MSVALPVWEPDPQRRLDLIAARTSEAKADQHPAAVTGLLAMLARTPLGRGFPDLDVLMTGMEEDARKLVRTEALNHDGEARKIKTHPTTCRQPAVQTAFTRAHPENPHQ